ncbi:MAG: hypothetical protein JWN93_3749 [Hyphomicrobiales bacterium]|nr:hypothetical protein [Hyphomicrobiales bacterium]
MALTLRASGRSFVAGEGGRLAWYASRARRMNAPEMAHRALRIASDAASFVRLKATGSPFGSPSASAAHLRQTRDCLPGLAWDAQALARDAEDLLAGRVSYGGFVWRFDDSDAVWRRAPDSGQYWPMTYAPWLSHRAGNPIGDVRITWEPNRLQQLIGLALLANGAGGDAAARLLSAQLRSWVRLNPPMLGVNYTSAMECGQRLLSVCYAAHLARDALAHDEAFWSDVAWLTQSHCRIIADRLSLHSSLGNHTVAESVALFTACLVAPSSQSARWEACALDALRQACGRVFLKDGGSAEQSTAYHVLVLDLLHLAILVGERHGRNMAVFHDWRNAGSAFLRALSSNGRLPHIGDSDSSYSLSRYMVPCWRLSAAREPAEPLVTFHHGGYSVVRLARVTAIVDHGPLGMQPNYAHGHSDALSVLLELDGRPVLIDAGTCAYADREGWRDYFRSVRAHNTVRVGDDDQACATGPFLWSNPPQVTLEAAIRTEEGALLVARHDGYMRIGVMHQRGLLITPDRMVVLDRLTGNGAAPLCALRWHFAGVLTFSGASRFTHQPTGTSLHVSDGTCALLRQSMEPRGGWMSPRYGEIEGASTVECDATGPGEFLSIFTFPWASATAPHVHEADVTMLAKAMSGGSPSGRRSP